VNGFKLIVWAALFGVLLPLSAHAQSDAINTCGMVSRTEALQNAVTKMLGPWHINHQAGYVVVGGMSLPYPNAGDNETITFERRGVQLIATHPEMQAPMVFKIATGADWDFANRDTENGILRPPLSFEDMGLAVDCDITNMPRLIGTTTAVVEGISMHFTMRIMIANTDVMFGVLHMEGVAEGYPYYSRRSVLLTR